MAEDVMGRDRTGEFESPGGFVFGIVGWTWGDQRPSAITFFLNGTCKVSDQHGRPIKGTVHDNKPIYFDRSTHAQVIAALTEERVDWRKLTCAGWPQLPYDQLKVIPANLLPPVGDTDEERESYLNQLRKIPDPAIRKDALRFRCEVYSNREKESQTTVED